MEDITFTFFSENDISELVKLNKKLVPAWYHYDGLKRGKLTTYDKLSHREQFIHGGPWLSEATLKIHMNGLLKFGKVILMYYQDELVGEIEYHKMDSECDENNTYYHIDWMMICPKHQGKRYGTILIEHLISLLENKYSNNIVLITEPECGIERFYYSFGFERKPANIKIYKASGKNGNKEWNEGIPELYDHFYGNYDMSDEYSKFLINEEVTYCDIFGSGISVQWKKYTEDITVIKLSSCIIHNHFKLLVNSDDIIDEDRLLAIFEDVLDYAGNEEQFYLNIPQYIQSKSWKLTSEVPKLIYKVK